MVRSNFDLGMLGVLVGSILAVVEVVAFAVVLVLVVEVVAALVLVVVLLVVELELEEDIPLVLLAVVPLSMVAFLVVGFELEVRLRF